MKEQFLADLENALKGNVSDTVLRETMAYYRSYIEEQIRLGRSEKEVIEELGSGSMIAKSVINAKAAEQDTYEQETYSESYHEETGKVPVMTKIKIWAIIFAVLVVVLALAGLVIRILWVLLPFILIAGVIIWMANRV